MLIDFKVGIVKFLEIFLLVFNGYILVMYVLEGSYRILII